MGVRQATVQLLGIRLTETMQTGHVDHRPPCRAQPNPRFLEHNNQPSDIDNAVPRSCFQPNDFSTEDIESTKVSSRRVIAEEPFS